MSAKLVSRRRFLKIGCIATAAAGLTVCGGASLVGLAPEAPIDLPSLSYGEKTMDKRVLIAYATYAGSTAEVAAGIGKTLASRGFAVDCKPIREKPAVDGYQAVLIGSAVQYGKWLPEAVEFVQANQPALNRLPVALFCVHIQNTGNDENSRKARLAYLDVVRPLVQPVAEAFFAGRFDQRGAARLMPGLLARLMPAFDLRDWKKINAWAQTVLA